jgi:hypothetical protein
MNTNFSRRRFLSGAAATGAGLLILRNSASAWSYQANEKLNIALIGVGVRGGSHHVHAFPRIGENLVALCDVNDKQLEGPAKLLPAAHPGYLPPQFPGAGGVPESPALIGWNRWRDFGGGALGGAGSHSLNLAFKAFNLQSLWDSADAKQTIRVTTEISERCPENFPRCQLVHFELPARGGMPPAQIHWCNAWNAEIERRGILDRLEKLAGQPLQWKEGSWSAHSFLLIVGSQGMALANFHNSVCQLLPERDFPNAGGPPQKLPRSGSHEREWVAACKGGPLPMANFDHAGPMIELLNLGNVASAVDRPLEFAPATMKIVNDAEADGLMQPPYRQGWSL